MRKDSDQRVGEAEGAVLILHDPTGTYQAGGYLERRGFANSLWCGYFPVGLRVALRSQVSGRGYMAVWSKPEEYTVKATGVTRKSRRFKMLPECVLVGPRTLRAVDGNNLAEAD